MTESGRALQLAVRSRSTYNWSVSTSILATKLYIPPSRPKTVLRPRLIEQLNEGLHHKLTLISAPAGFGKTTLVSEWLAGCERPAAWLSLDDGDNDSTRFLTYLGAALQAALHTVSTDFGEGVMAVLQSPQPPPTESILTTLLNEITTVPEEFIVVLDDYHVIDANPVGALASVDDVLTFLLEHLPPQMHLVIVTREDPQLHLARLRAQGQLTELRVTDLRFNNAEAASFLNQAMGLSLSAEDIAALERRTEGWIAGLQLAALAMQGTLSMPGHGDAAGFIQSFTGSHRFVLDYLVEEVLQQQSQSLQTFFLKTAVLDRLTGSLCDALTDQDNGQQTLEYIEHANLFIVPLDGERRWYRYHHLFADLLRQRLHQEQSEHLPVLQCKASEWYEQNGFANEAIAYALRAGDFERAARLMEQASEVVWLRGEDAKLRRWLDGLPAEVVSSKPTLCIFHAWSLFATGQQDTAQQRLQWAEQALDSGSTTQELERPPDFERIRLRGRIAATRAFAAFYRGAVPEMIQFSRQALDYLPDQDLSWRSAAINTLGDGYDFKGDVLAAHHARIAALEAIRAAGNGYQNMIANLKLAINLRQQGQLQRVIEICRQQNQFAGENGMAQTVVAGWSLSIWGEALAEINDLAGAIDRAKRGVRMTERGGDLAMLGWSYLCLIRVRFSRGELIGAQDIVQKMEHITQATDMPPWITRLAAAWRARILLAQGQLQAATQWVAERGLDATIEHPTYLREREYILLARILIAQGRQGSASVLLQRLLKATEAGARSSRMIEILLLQALVARADGQTSKSMNTLEQALTLAEPGGFIQLFVDEGLPMAKLLSEAVALGNRSGGPSGSLRGSLLDYCARLLAAFEAQEQRGADRPFLPPAPPAQPLMDQLSRRELEVLQLIAQGLSNREIAQRLFLALNTVKGHNRNIFEKLQVHRRTEAVARARALGLL